MWCAPSIPPSATQPAHRDDAHAQHWRQLHRAGVALRRYIDRPLVAVVAIILVLVDAGVIVTHVNVAIAVMTPRCATRLAGARHHVQRGEHGLGHARPHDARGRQRHVLRGGGLGGQQRLAPHRLGCNGGAFGVTFPVQQRSCGLQHSPAVGG
jgi:hypothetical protein